MQLIHAIPDCLLGNVHLAMFGEPFLHTWYGPVPTFVDLLSQFFEMCAVPLRVALWSAPFVCLEGICSTGIVSGQPSGHTFGVHHELFDYLIAFLALFGCYYRF